MNANNAKTIMKFIKSDRLMDLAIGNITIQSGADFTGRSFKTIKYFYFIKVYNKNELIGEFVYDDIKATKRITLKDIVKPKHFDYFSNTIANNTMVQRMK